ncbi:MAG: hypothetical protein ACYC6T_16160 [Thermoleophilia bacterium]
MGEFFSYNPARAAVGCRFRVQRHPRQPGRIGAELPARIPCCKFKGPFITHYERAAFTPHRARPVLSPVEQKVRVDAVWIVAVWHGAQLVNPPDAPSA